MTGATGTRRTPGKPGTPARHRAPGRPRYGRIGVLAASTAVTLVAVLAGAGLIPGTTDQAPAVTVAIDPAPTTEPSAEPTQEPTQEPTEQATVEPAQEIEREPVPAPPASSGSGRRAVFDQSEQRVWIVSGSERVLHTYLVSGSLTDNLSPGTYEVFSRSEDAVGIDGSTMGFFVRFTRGPTGAAIGFHDLPEDDGRVVQTLDQLGTPQSHGCIRQKRSDAKRMWRFASLGTTVVVTA